MKTVMVVEDHADTNFFLCRIIRKWGHATLSVYDGKEALELNSGVLPDLMILDEMMPEMTGVQVLEILRANPKTAKIPIVMYTAISDTRSREMVLEKGANDCWQKGTFDLGRLQGEVTKYLSN